MAPRSSPLLPLVAALRDLVRWMAASEVPGIVIGGVAASILGRPRVTGDVDALVWLADDRWKTFLAAGARFDIHPRRTDVLAFARRSRVLLLRHEPSAIDLDVSLGALPFEQQSIARARTHRIGNLRIPIVSPEDLIVMKAIAHRPRDLGDIEGVLAMHPDLDRARVRHWVKEFANALDAPELLDDLSRLLNAKSPGTQPRARRRKPPAR